MEYTSDSDDSFSLKELTIADVLKSKTRNKILRIKSFESLESTDTDDSLSGGYKLDVVKTFINKIKNNPRFKKTFKNYYLKNIAPTGKEIIMATIIDVSHVKKVLSKDIIKEDDLKEYIVKGDYIPLMYGNTDHKNIVYLKQVNSRGRKKIVRSKKTVFNDNNRPIIFFFKVSSNLNFVEPTKKDKEDDNIATVEDNMAIVEYVVGRYFMLIPNPKDNIKIKSIEAITYSNGSFTTVPYKGGLDYEFQKMTIEEFENLLGTIVKKLTKFE